MFCVQRLSLVKQGIGLLAHLEALSNAIQTPTDGRTDRPTESSTREHCASHTLTRASGITEILVRNFAAQQLRTHQ
jgi:hypothetical protein